MMTVIAGRKRQSRVIFRNQPFCVDTASRPAHPTPPVLFGIVLRDNATIHFPSGMSDEIEINIVRIKPAKCFKVPNPSFV